MLFLLPTLPLLIFLVLCQLLHLPLQLLGLSAQHLLLPALLESLLRILLLIGKLFLPLGQRVQLRQRVFYLLLLLFLGRSGLRRLVLILLRIQFQVEQAGKIASSAAAASTTAALLPEGDLNFPERCLCAQ